MKIRVCDVHLAHGLGYVKAGWQRTFRDGVQSVKIDICEDHKKGVLKYAEAVAVAERSADVYYAR